jgi:hypothetical protein
VVAVVGIKRTLLKGMVHPAVLVVVVKEMLILLAKQDQVHQTQVVEEVVQEEVQIQQAMVVLAL